MGKQPSRIIFTVVNDLTYDQRMHRICRSLARAGHEVLLVGRTRKSSLPLEEESFRQLRLRPFFTKGKLFYAEYNIRLFFFLLFQKFDIVCGIDLDTILPCYVVSRLKRKKCAYDAHELFPEVPEVIHRAVIKKTWSAIEKFSVRNIIHCYTVSDGLAEYFEKKYGRKFEVIRNVPVLNEAKTTYVRQQDDELFILYQGALNEGRGLEHLIEAMERIPVRLKLAGEGDLSFSLRQIVKEKQLGAQVEFTGNKKPDELKLLTEQSFISVNLLENRGLSYYYSLANKFFDAVHAGIPQITMNFPEYQKLNAIYEVALLVDDLETNTLANAILKLLHDKDCYFRLRENSLAARLDWNWQKEEQKLLSFYRQL